MENSVGFVIIWNNKILLSHPKKQGYDTWGIAKGKIEENESYLDCAIRETREEIGLNINIDLLKQGFVWKTITYKNLKNKAYKHLHYTVININNLSDIGMVNENIDYEQLCPKEIDEAKFMSYEDAIDKIFWRQKELLDFLI